MEDQLPDRVRAAKERREFRQLLDQSSIARSPKGFEDCEGAIGSGQCQPCREDRCGDVECAIPQGCACTCMADKSALTKELLEIFGQHPSHLDEVARELYARGWRREA